MMGLEIIAKPGPIPREMMLKLTCDGDHGLLPATSYTFEGDPGAQFPELFRAAMAMGWKETYVLAVKPADGKPKVGTARLFLCPECSGKSPQGELNA